MTVIQRLLDLTRCALRNDARHEWVGFDCEPPVPVECGACGLPKRSYDTALQAASGSIAAERDALAAYVRAEDALREHWFRGWHRPHSRHPRCECYGDHPLWQGTLCEVAVVLVEDCRRARLAAGLPPIDVARELMGDGATCDGILDGVDPEQAADRCTKLAVAVSRHAHLCRHHAERVGRPTLWRLDADQIDPPPNRMEPPEWVGGHDARATS